MWALGTRSSGSRFLGYAHMHASKVRFSIRGRKMMSGVAGMGEAPALGLELALAVLHRTDSVPRSILLGRCTPEILRALPVHRSNGGSPGEYRGGRGQTLTETSRHNGVGIILGIYLHTFGNARVTIPKWMTNT